MNLCFLPLQVCKLHTGDEFPGASTLVTYKKLFLKKYEKIYNDVSEAKSREFNEDVSNWYTQKNHNGRPSAITPEQESLLYLMCKYWCESDLPELGDGLTVQYVTQLMDALRAQNGVVNTPTDRKAIDRFLKKYPDIKKTRGREIKTERFDAAQFATIRTYFGVLKTALFDEYGKPRPYLRILNLDESMMSGGSLHIAKQRGKTYLTTGDNLPTVKIPQLGKHITLLGICNATGDGCNIPDMLPPVVIAAKTQDKNGTFTCPATAFKDSGLPKGTLFTANESGFMNAKLFMQILTQHLPKNVSGFVQGVQDQILVICDAPTHHSLSEKELSQLRVEWGINVVFMPHNTSLWLQPCDQKIFQLLKIKWKKELSEYAEQHHGRAPTMWEMMRMLHTSLLHAFTRDSVSNFLFLLRTCSS